MNIIMNKNSVLFDLKADLEELSFNDSENIYLEEWKKLNFMTKLFCGCYCIRKRK
jgi:hypothetical protein